MVGLLVGEGDEHLRLSPVRQTLPDVLHIRIADSRGKPLGRSFRVKLWPTLVLLRDGKVVDQLVRPEENEVRRALERLVAE